MSSIFHRILGAFGLGSQDPLLAEDTVSKSIAKNKDDARGPTTRQMLAELREVCRLIERRTEEIERVANRSLTQLHKLPAKQQGNDTASSEAHTPDRIARDLRVLRDQTFRRMKHQLLANFSKYSRNELEHALLAMLSERILMRAQSLVIHGELDGYVSTIRRELFAAIESQLPGTLQNVEFPWNDPWDTPIVNSIKLVQDIRRGAFRGVLFVEPIGTRYEERWHAPVEGTALFEDQEVYIGRTLFPGYYLPEDDYVVERARVKLDDGLTGRED